MTRQEILKAVLMGQSVTPTALKEQAGLEWATKHDPLMSPSAFSVTGRHLNHFCVGSDPEFCFVSGDGKADAVTCGMKVGLAAGADQNERLIELRPWPSVSVVEHIAGVLTALRWMYRVYNRYAATFVWRAGAYFAGDGLGGHVHFGRKRPTRTEEVAALDGLARVFKTSGLFPLHEWNARMRGDRLNQVYGQPGDYRIQRHGYEYRSLPSWLQSPTVAFIAVASSKLAVLDPEITTSWPVKIQVDLSRKLLRGLAKLYKSRDDDAYVLYHLLTREGDFVFQVDHGADFAPAWGFPRNVAHTDEEASTILPACIPPHPSEIEEMQNHLLLGTPLTFHALPAEFVSTLPRNSKYRWVPQYVATGRHSGFGDLIHNLVTNRDFDLAWSYGNADQFQILGDLPERWSKSDTLMLRRFFPRIRITHSIVGSTTIVIPKCLCQTTTIAGLRAILLKSGLFPIWTVEDVKRESLALWLKEHPVQKQTIPVWRNY